MSCLGLATWGDEDRRCCGWACCVVGGHVVLWVGCFWFWDSCWRELCTKRQAASAVIDQRYSEKKQEKERKVSGWVCITLATPANDIAVGGRIGCGVCLRVTNFFVCAASVRCGFGDGFCGGFGDGFCGGFGDGFCGGFCCGFCCGFCDGFCCGFGDGFCGGWVGADTRLARLAVFALDTETRIVFALGGFAEALMAAKDRVGEFADILGALAFDAKFVLWALFVCARIIGALAVFTAFALGASGAVFDADTVDGTAMFVGCALFVCAGIKEAFSSKAKLTLWARICITTDRCADLLRTDIVTVASGVVVTRSISCALTV